MIKIPTMAVLIYKNETKNVFKRLNLKQKIKIYVLKTILVLFKNKFKFSESKHLKFTNKIKPFYLLSLITNKRKKQNNLNLNCSNLISSALKKLL